MARGLQSSGSRQTRGWLDPFEAMQEDIDKILGGYLRRMPTIGGSDGAQRQLALLDVRETDDKIKIEVDMPGVKIKDIEITLADNRLCVRGKRESSKEETGENFHLVEREFGEFERRINLPSEVDVENVNALLDEGVLKITLPKSAQAKEQAHRIEVHQKDSGEAAQKETRNASRKAPQETSQKPVQ